MAKIKYDVKGVDAGGDRPLPKPGVYRAKVISCVDAKPEGKDRRLEVQYQITEGDHKGFVLYDYVNLESEASKWKLAQFVKAMGLGESGSLDPDEIVGTGLSVRVRIDPGNDQFGPSARPATLIALDGENDEEEEDLSEDVEDDGDDDGDEDETYTEEELTELDDDDLKEVAEELEVDVDEHSKKVKKGKKTVTKLDRDALIAAILEAQGEDEDDDEESEDGEDEDGEDEVYTEDELKELSNDDLKEVAEELELEVPARLTAKSKPKLIAAILEAQEGDDEEEDGDDDEEDGEETPDFDSMELAELKAEAKKRNLSPKGPKGALVARLKKDDSPF